MTRNRRFAALGVAALLASSETQGQQRYAAIVEQILTAWKTADVVCLGEDHGRVFDSDLRIALVRHPAFPQTVRTIIVESANPIHQDLLDRFVLEGAAMTRRELAPIWRDASNPETWESPIYEQFLRVVREVNLGLPREQRIRVLGGDSKIDWTRIKTAEDLAPLVNRGGNIRATVAEQILDKHLKALAIYGGGHCLKIGRGFPGELVDKYSPERFWSIAGLLRTSGVEEGRRVFGLGGDPAYIVLRGTKWESTPASGLLTAQQSAQTIGRLFDAIVYHGAVPDSVAQVDLTDLMSTYGPELERRKTLLADALKIWLQRQRRPGG